MNILEKYLNKLGVKSFTELNDEEKDTYRAWEESLSGRRLTDDDVNEFLQAEEEETINKLIGESLKTQEDIFLKVKLQFIRNVRRFLNAPKVEKQIVENNIANLVK